MHVQAVSDWRDKAKVAAFFGRLAVKEHVRPDLHVRPLVAELFLTDNCNLRCTSCACWRTTTRQELTTAEWKTVIDQLRPAGIVKANFTGGEPLMRRDAPELIAHAMERGVRRLHLNTNAVLLDDTRRRAVLEAGVRSFNVSVDGPTAATHEAVRGVPRSFERTMAHLQDLVAARRRYSLRLRLSFTVMATTVSTLPEMMRFAQRVGVPLYLNLATDKTFLFRDEQVSREADVGRGDVDRALAQIEALLRTDPHGLPSFAELSYLRRHFGDLVQADLPCAESQLKLMIHSRGEIGGCWAHDPHDNVRQTSVADVIASARYRDDHARFFRKDCVGCGSNYSLNLSWRPHTHVENALWRAGRRSLLAGDRR
ncbi:MAG: radical SAM protein [Nocardioidaceae bacterium]